LVPLRRFDPVTPGTRRQSPVLDDIFIERLRRSLKNEDVFIKAYTSVAQARSGIGAWLGFYNDTRLHQALGYRTPREIFTAALACGYVDNAAASLRSAPAVITYPQAPQQQQKGSIDTEKVLHSCATLFTRGGGFATGGSLS
jgi:putative transposase